MDYSILATELSNAAYVGMTPHEAAESLNATNEIDAVAQLVSITELKGYCVTKMIVHNDVPSNLWLVIKSQATAGSIPSGMLWDLFNDPAFQTIDFVVGGIQMVMFLAGLDEFVADTTIAFDETKKSEVQTEVFALAQKTSPAKRLNLGHVRPIDVSIARGN